MCKRFSFRLCVPCCEVIDLTLKRALVRIITTPESKPAGDLPPLPGLPSSLNASHFTVPPPPQIFKANKFTQTPRPGSRPLLGLLRDGRPTVLCVFLLPCVHVPLFVDVDTIVDSMQHACEN